MNLGKIYLRQLVAWGAAAFCLLTAFVVIFQGEFDFLRDSRGWSWGRVVALVTATVITSALATILALWFERPRRSNQG